MNENTSNGNSTEQRIRVLAEVIQAAALFIGGREVERDKAEKQAFAWFHQLRAIPTDALEQCVREWEGTGPRQGLRPLDLIDGWRAVRDSRQRAEALREAQAQVQSDTVACWFCGGQGYQFLYYRKHSRWYSAARPCCCKAAPFVQRRSPLHKPEYVRNAVGEYCAQLDLDEFGPPTAHWEADHTATPQQTRAAQRELETQMAMTPENKLPF